MAQKDVVSVRVCPQCKSVNVKYIFALRNALGMMPRQKCFDCQFESDTFPVLEVEKRKLAKLNREVKQ